MNDESIQRVAAQAAARLSLALGHDEVWRGRCPCCAYGKPTLQIKVENRGIAVACAATFLCVSRIAWLRNVALLDESGRPISLRAGAA